MFPPITARYIYLLSIASTQCLSLANVSWSISCQRCKLGDEDHNRKWWHHLLPPCQFEGVHGLHMRLQQTPSLSDTAKHTTSDSELRRTSGGLIYPPPPAPPCWCTQDQVHARVPATAHADLPFSTATLQGLGGRGVWGYLGIMAACGLEGFGAVAGLPLGFPSPQGPRAGGRRGGFHCQA